MIEWLLDNDIRKEVNMATNHWHYTYGNDSNYTMGTDTSITTTTASWDTSGTTAWTTYSAGTTATVTATYTITTNGAGTYYCYDDDHTYPHVAEIKNEDHFKQWHQEIELTKEEKAQLKEKQRVERMWYEIQREANAEIRAIEEKERQEKLNRSQDRALKLLRTSLSKKQLERFEKDQCIPVDTAKGNKYLIRKGRSGNVWELDKNGKAKAKLCAHPVTNVPDYDTMLAQKLYLEHMEDEFLRMANRTPIH
jgi:hypothetical protein